MSNIASIFEFTYFLNFEFFVVFKLDFSIKFLELKSIFPLFRTTFEKQTWKKSRRFGNKIAYFKRKNYYYPRISGRG